MDYRPSGVVLSIVGKPAVVTPLLWTQVPSVEALPLPFSPGSDPGVPRELQPWRMRCGLPSFPAWDNLPLLTPQQLPGQSVSSGQFLKDILNGFLNPERGGC